MRNRHCAVFAIAVLAGGGLAYGTYNMVQNQPKGTASVATQPVVVAAADLQLGSELKKEDLTIVNFPAGQAPEGTFTQPSDLVGRGLIAPIVKNEPVLPSKLASKEAGAGLPPVIPEGMRAVSVRVNEVIGVAGYVLPGTRVDVVCTASPTEGRADTTSKLILSNVQVLTAGTRMEQDQEKGKPMQVTVVTLLVNPEQSERLALASTEGKIQLALRNPLDQTSPETPGVKTAALVGTARALAPASRTSGSGQVRRSARASAPAGPVTQTVPMPDALPTVEVIRGDKRSQEVIK
jgi:pilus assembly protein CpaB